MNGRSVPALLTKGDRVNVQLLGDGKQFRGIFLRYFMPENGQILKAEIILESGHYTTVDLVNIILEPVTRDAGILAGEQPSETWERTGRTTARQRRAVEKRPPRRNRLL